MINGWLNSDDEEQLFAQLLQRMAQSTLPSSTKVNENHNKCRALCFLLHLKSPKNKVLLSNL